MRLMHVCFGRDHGLELFMTALRGEAPKYFAATEIFPTSCAGADISGAT